MPHRLDVPSQVHEDPVNKHWLYSMPIKNTATTARCFGETNTVNLRRHARGTPPYPPLVCFCLLKRENPA